MTLLTCPECGKEYSSMAAACPHCGYTRAKDVRTAEGCGIATGKLGKTLTCCITVPLIIVLILIFFGQCGA
jgi:ribosomal protein L37E